MQHQKIIVLDFGSQVTQLIARRVRDAGVFCEVHPGDVDNEFIKEQKQQNLKGIILSGSHSSAYDEASIKVADEVFNAGVPVLGICYGMQTMAQQLGGEVSFSETREFGDSQVIISKPNDLFNTLSDFTDSEGRPGLDVWMSHGDKVISLPPGFEVIAENASCPIAAMADTERQFYGVQFHPEATHTKQGEAILKRFVLDICQTKADWNMPDYAGEAIDNIRKQVGDEQVILALSGGVDSSVAAVLIGRAIGDQLTCVFVDHGLLRHNEGKEVMDLLSEHLGVNIIHVDAVDQFMGKLAGVTDPEQKRKIIGREFIEVFQEEAGKLPNAKWLAQGTIYPDVIESASHKGAKSVAIKSHHNVGGLPETLNLKLLEPLRELFKDEVRRLGITLGLPESLVYRHPFPGPGLGVRILGEVKKEYADMLRKADHIFTQELRNTIDEKTGKSWYELTSQAFVVFIPVKSVGVMGDGRTYEYVVSLRAVETIDFMSASWAQLPYSLLGRVSGRIINEVKGINRVVYDVSSKPPATIEWE